MRIAEAKRKENIVEYILYMWQIESLIRANDLDLQKINEKLIQPQVKDQKERKAYLDWYRDLILKMKAEGIEQTGHLAEINDLMMELLYLHNMLLSTLKDNKYRQIFETAIPDIEAFQKKTKIGGLNFIETMLFGMNAQLLFRLQDKAVSDETKASFEKFRKVLAYLANQYNRMQRGAMDFTQN